eukprot:1187812-Prorocentrum_minimum.AAC.5
METMRVTVATFGGNALSNTRYVTLKIDPMAASGLTHPRRPFSSNSCPGQPKSKQLAGGHASTAPVRFPSSPSVAFAPRSHMAATVGSTPAPHR